MSQCLSHKTLSSLDLQSCPAIHRSLNESLVIHSRLQRHVRVNRKMCLRHYEWVNNKTRMFAVLHTLAVCGDAGRRGRKSTSLSILIARSSVSHLAATS